MGRFPLRPDHKDMWLLAAIVQDYDMVMDDALSDEEKDRRHANLVASMIDADSLAYLAMQRAMRMVGAETQGDVRDNREEITKLASCYFEAVLVGIAVERRRTKEKQ